MRAGHPAAGAAITSLRSAAALRRGHCPVTGCPSTHRTWQRLEGPCSSLGAEAELSQWCWAQGGSGTGFTCACLAHLPSPSPSPSPASLQPHRDPQRRRLGTCCQFQGTPDPASSTLLCRVHQASGSQRVQPPNLPQGKLSPTTPESLSTSSPPQSTQGKGEGTK